MTLAQLLARQARIAADRPAIFEGERPWATHAQWAARSAALAQRLRDAGLAPGDRVVVFMRNHPRYLEILWAAWWAGLVVVPVNAKLHPAEVEWIVADAQARWGFVTRDVAPAPPRAEPPHRGAPRASRGPALGATMHSPGGHGRFIPAPARRPAAGGRTCAPSSGRAAPARRCNAGPGCRRGRA